MIQSLWNEIRSITFGKREVRSFGRVVGGLLLLVAGVVLWQSDWHVTAWVVVIGGAGAVLLTLQAVFWRALKPVYRFWMSLALILGFLMTNVLLTLVYLLVVTPIALVMRAVGKDPLNRRIDRSARSYWLKKEPRDEGPRHLEKYY